MKGKNKSEYDWSEQEMREACEMLAREEVYNRSGELWGLKEKKLLGFARSEKEEKRIKSILAESRLKIVNEAKSDPDWDKECSPKVETELEAHERRKRRGVTVLGAAFLSVIFVCAMLAIQSDNSYIANVKTNQRSAVFYQAIYNDDKDQKQIIKPDSNTPSTGLIVSNFQIGSKDGAKIEVKGKGSLTCVIINSKNGKVVDENTADDSVSCSTD